MKFATALARLHAAGITLGADEGGPYLDGDPSTELVVALREHRPLLELVVPARCATAPLPPVVRYITRAVDLEAAAADLASHKTLGFDVETTGLDPCNDRLRLVQVAIPDGRVYVFDHTMLGTLGPVVEVLRDAELVGHNLLFDLKFLGHHVGVSPRGAWCTQTASKLLDGGLHLHEKGFHTLQGLTARTLGVHVPKDDQTSDWSGALVSHQLSYAARDAAITLLLRDVMVDTLEAQKLSDVAALEFALLPVLASMWTVGVGFDQARWETLVASRRRTAEALRESLRRELRADPTLEPDEEVNPNSQRQVLAAFRRRGLKVKSTNKAALASHATDPVVADLLRYRSLMCFLRGPGRSLPEAATRYADGRVRAELNPLAAPTGRFGCSAPNLQGLEKGGRTQGEDSEVCDPRSCVVPPPSDVFIDADFAAIELRGLAHETRDPRLMQIFRDGGDPHRAMAAMVSKKPEAEVTKAERNRAKPVNFGFPFGMGAERFVEYALASYGVAFTPGEAEAFKAAWQRMFSGVVAWQRRIGKAAPLTVRSASGRKRCFDSRVMGYCERLNMPIQGTAADGIKLAMVLLHGRLQPYRARLVLCVHDELLVECPREHAQAVKKLVEQTMIEAMSFFVPDVPIVVEADIRTTWSAEDVVRREVAQ